MRKIRLSIILLIWIIFPQTVWAADEIDPRYPQRQYRRLTLENNLKVLLISDPQLNTSSASLAVRAGSLDDPETRQGLAHFTEHMLFLGTKKYPQPGEYHKFVSEHDGFTNAYTAEDHTNYHFQVSSKHFEEALDRFAQFFISPLFLEEYIQKEVNAVNAEHSKNIPSDPFRTPHIIKKAAFWPHHPVTKFFTGNLTTLGTVTQAEVIDFYQKKYSSNLMTLAVLGKEDLNTLESWVVPKFQLVENKNYAFNTYPLEYLPKEPFYRFLQIQPVNDTEQLQFLFPLPPTRKDFRTQSDHILAFLIGHEGPGSLLSYLKKENLGTALFAGDHSNDSFADMEINVVLTQHGRQNIEQIVEIVFSYLAMLKKEGLPHYVFDEIRRINEISYLFQERAEGADMVRNLATNMQFLPLDYVEKSHLLLTDFAPDKFQKLLQSFVPTNMLVTLLARDAKADQTESFYQAKFSYQKSTPAFFQKLKNPQILNSLKLPPQNPWLPKNFALLEIPGAFQYNQLAQHNILNAPLPTEIKSILDHRLEKKWADWSAFKEDLSQNKIDPEPYKKTLLRSMQLWPELLFDQSEGKVYFAPDQKFFTPKAQIDLLFETPRVYDSPKNSVLAQLYVEGLKEYLNEFHYMTVLAGIDFKFEHHKKGIVLSVTGYSDQLLSVLNEISQQLTNFKLEPKTFANLINLKKREYENFKFEQPIQQAMYQQSLLLEKQKYSMTQYREAINHITLKDVRHFSKNVFTKVFLEGFVFGNLPPQETKQSLLHMLKTLGSNPLPKEQTYSEKWLALPNQQQFTLQLHSAVANNAVLSYLQIGASSPMERAVFNIVTHRMRNEFFNDLRTTQQLGYIVEAGLMERSDILGLIYMIQSDGFEPNDVQSRIDAFKDKFKKSLLQLREEDFNTLKNGVLSRYLQQIEVQSEYAKILFSVIIEYNAEFDRRNKNYIALKQLTLPQLQETFERVMSNNNLLNIHFYGNKIPFKTPKDKLIKNIPEFKNSLN